MKIVPISSPVPNSRAFRMGECSIILAREVHGRVLASGNLRWHLSISCAKRYPTWHEIKHARYALIPDDCTMAMLLPPKSEFVNIHQNCFHLYEIPGDE